MVPHRYQLAVVGALGLLPVVGGRKCFAMILTHLTSQNKSEQEENLVFSGCTVFNTSVDTGVTMGADVMFLLHATYFAGCPLLQLPGTILATRVSPSRVVGVSVLLTCLISLTLPLVIQLNIHLLFPLRFIQGALEGIQQTVSVGLLSAWCTESDKTRLFGIYYTGAYIAPAFASLIAGSTLCYVSWDSSLYIYGAVGVLWSVLWMSVVYDTPHLHPNLTETERRLHSPQHGDILTTGSAHRQQWKKIPWRSILTCLPVWAMLVGTFCRTFIYSMLVVEQPQYYKDAFSLNVADIGLLSMVPHVGLTVSCTLGGIVSDKLLAWGMTTTITRKLLYSIGNGVEGLCLLALYLTSGWKSAMILISAGVAVGGLAEAGYSPLPADLAPQYAGLIAGVCLIGNVGAVANTVLASFITGKSKAIADWQFLFLISGIIHLLGVLTFDLIANARRQPWADYSTADALQAHEEENAIDFKREDDYDVIESDTFKVASPCENSRGCAEERLGRAHLSGERHKRSDTSFSEYEPLLK